MMVATRFLSLSFALATLAAAADTCSSSTASPAYYPVPGFPRSDGCYPTTYIATYDLGNTNPQDAQTRCSQQCNANVQCNGYLAQLNQAADNPQLYSGTCFLYNAVPTQLRQCANKPTVFYGSYKDTAPSCFSSSRAAASSFCSSYISYSTVTVYTSTVTPSTVLTISASATSTIITLTTQTSTSTATISSSTTSTSTSVTTAVSTLTTYADGEMNLRKRAVASPTCLPPNAPASVISSDCSCFITKTTVTRIATAPTKTNTVYSTAVTTTTALSIISTSTTTSVSTVFTSVTGTTTTTTTATTVDGCQLPATNYLVNGGFETSGTSGWLQTVNGGGANFAAVTSPNGPVLCGTAAATIFNTAATITASKAFSAPSGRLTASVFLSLSLSTQHQGPGGPCTITLQCNGATSSFGDNLLSNNRYSRFSVTCGSVTGGSAGSFSLALVCPKSTYTTILVDQVSVS